jgi:rubrerythrin
MVTEVSCNAQAVQMLIENEEGLAKLYQAYAVKFPVFASFWSQLAAEEVKHANWVRELQMDIKYGTIRCNEHRFDTELISAYLDEVEQHLSDALHKKLTLYEALNTALFLERTYIEKSFFQIFEGDTETAKRVLDVLAHGTQTHIQRIEALWERYRPK